MPFKKNVSLISKLRAMKNILVKLVFVALLLLLAACSESPDRLESKLTPYLQEDLKFMVAEVIKAGHPEMVADSPYYVIRDLRFFDGVTAEGYSGYSEVDFYVYKTVKMHQKRKYRYDAHYMQWDRYFKKLEYGGINE